jgi:hypothetical protein
MSISTNSKWLTEHRGWEDILSVCVGILIILSPWIAGADEHVGVMVNAGFVGVLIAALALLEMVQLRRWEEILEMICGAWVVASPFVFQFDGALRTLSFVLGGTVVVLAIFELWQDGQRKLEN